MEEQTIPDAIPAPAATGDARSRLVERTTKFLSHLVFGAHALRFSLELMLCIGLFAAIDPLILAFGFDSEWRGLSAWACACLIVSAFDHFLLVPPYFNYRRAIAFASQGKIGAALELIDSIGPFSKGYIKLPRGEYFRIRCEMLIQCEHFADAEQELAIGEQLGLSKENAGILRAQLRRSQGKYFDAFAAIENAAKLVGEASVALQLETALTQFEERKSLRQAGKLFEAIAKKDDAPLPGGYPTRALARAYHQLCRLWTGYAEEAIIELSRELEILAAQYAGVEALRPHLARLYLERSFYFATHAEPERAHVDLRIGQLLCGQPSTVRLVTKIKEELAWRALPR